MNKFDLIVVGGGLAGVAAAVSAARQNLNVLLIEKSGCLGGAVSNNLVYPFMRYTTRVDGEKMLLSRGIFEEILTQLKSYNQNFDGSGFLEEDLKIILTRMAVDNKVSLLLHSFLSDAVIEDGKIKGVEVVNKAGKQVYEADYFVDATGDADLAVFSGCSTSLGREQDNLCQPMTLCFRMANVKDMDKHQDFFAKVREINKVFQEHKKAGKITIPREDIGAFYHPTEGVIHFNTTRIIMKNPIDPIELSKAEVEAREQVHELVNFLKSNFKEFKDAVLIQTAPEIGVRESRKIDGVYKLTVNDILECKKFEDRIAACNYMIDIHDPAGSGTITKFFEEGTYYTIPYRCMIPKNVSNLIVAGRCLSSDHEAHSSYRIMPTCCTLGEAAGIASSVAYKEKVSYIDASIENIQKILIDNGAFIG